MNSLNDLTDNKENLLTEADFLMKKFGDLLREKSDLDKYIGGHENSKDPLSKTIQNYEKIVENLEEQKRLPDSDTNLFSFAD